LLSVRPNDADLHYKLGIDLNKKGDFQEAVVHWRKAVLLKPNEVVYANQMAWVLATCPTDTIRNGSEAVDLALMAVRLSKGREPAILDTLAAAYAEAGRFSEAVDTVELAVSLASARGDAALADIIRQRIMLYRIGKPYREAYFQAFPIR
jgi:Flp pilus assembly protein TadD